MDQSKRHQAVKRHQTDAPGTEPGTTDETKLATAERVTITLKYSHVNDIRARMQMIDVFRTLAQEQGAKAQKAHFAALWIDEAWQYCLEHRIATDKPDSLRDYAALIQFLVDDRNEEATKQNRYLKIAEALQESLTFFLAKEYDFDPLTEQWQIDIDHCLMISVPATQKEEALEETGVIESTI